MTTKYDLRGGNFIMTCGIYMIQNLVNGKIYIGQSVDIEKRWGDHKEFLRGNQNKPNKHLQSAWNKYGEDNFEFTVICECDESQLNTKEIDYIAKLKTYDPDYGYNKTYGGEGCRPTEETRRKQSEAQKGKNNPMYGKHLSEEAKRKIGKANKGRTPTEEHKIKVSKPIVQIDPSTHKAINVWGSSRDAERICGFTHQAIIQCCKNKFNREGNNIYKNYKWQYLHYYISQIDPRIRKVILFNKEYEF